MVSKGARLVALVSLVCAARVFCQESTRVKSSAWRNELSVGFAPTIFHAKYDGTNGDCWINGYAFTIDSRTVHRSNGFCVAAKAAIGSAGGNADFPGDSEEFTLDMDNLSGWDWWLSCTAGKRFENDSLSFTPTAGLCTSWVLMESSGQLSYSGSTYYCDWEMRVFQLALCADLAFEVILTGKVSISASLLVALTLWGSVSEEASISGVASSTQEYSLDTACVSFIPTFYLTIRL